MTGTGGLDRLELREDAADNSGVGALIDNVALVTSSNDTLDGGAGNDTLMGGSGAAVLIGGAGNDTLNGEAGNDTLDGGADNDTYILGLAAGTDTITEGGGTDTITIQSNGAALSWLDFTDSSTTAASGNLVINYNGQQATVTSHFAGGNNVVETLTFSGGATYAGFALGAGAYTLSIDDNGTRTSAAGVNTILVGASGAETLTGNTGNDLIFGGAGNDIISSGTGTNLMVGGAGDDSLTGGTGNDWLVGGTGNDTLAGARRHRHGRLFRRRCGRNREPHHDDRAEYGW